MTAKEIMTTEVKTVPADAPLVDVAGLLAERRISGMPVVDEEGTVVGIVTEADLIDGHRQKAQVPRIALYGLLPVPDDALLQAYRRGMDLQAKDVMTRIVITASEDTTVHELADLMVKSRISRVPIVRNGKLVGIVARSDLVRALARQLPDAGERGTDG